MISTATSLGVKTRTEAGLRRALKAGIGADEVILTDPLGERVLVSQAIVYHILEKESRLDGREQFFPFISELIEDPYEVWVNFSENQRTGKVGFRKKYVKGIQVKGSKVIGLVWM